MQFRNWSRDRFRLACVFFVGPVLEVRKGEERRNEKAGDFISGLVLLEQQYIECCENAMESLPG